MNAQLSFHAFLDSISKISDPTNKAVLIDTFFNHLDTAGIPYIEADTANFIYYGEADSVWIAGDFNGWGGNMQINAWRCNRIPETEFFYYSHVFEPTARLDYKFIINQNSWITDPRNPNLILGGFGANSELAMPEYVQPWEIEEYEGVEKGSIEGFKLESPQIGRNFDIKVYMPPGYDEASDFAFSTVYVHDGGEYISLANMDNVLDNLLDSGKIDPLLVVFISPKIRDDEYAFGNRNNFAAFIAETVVPYIDSAYKTYPHAQYRLTMGASFGGNISAIIAYKYPEVFGNTGWHSPALWPNEGEAGSYYYAGEKKDVKMYFNAGTYEFLGVDWFSFTEGLTNKGYDFDWKLFHEGHSWGLWRATIDDILTYFFPPGTTPLGIDEPSKALNSCSLYPNPTNSHVVIEATVKTKGTFWIDIYNQLGQLKSTSNEENGSSGKVKFEMDVGNLSSGVYFYILRGVSEIKGGKMIIK